MDNSPLIVAILGPTATGKSKLAHQLALKLNAEVISMDSAQVYRGMDIGTAKPTLEQQQQVPYHLINLVNSWENYNTARYIDDCLKAVQDIQARKKTILLTGGTMLYYHSLTQGISDLPSADNELRTQLQIQWQEDSKKIIQKLTDLDPVSAKKLHHNDKQRILRTLEIVLLSNKTRNQATSSRPTLSPDLTILLNVKNRQALHQLIAERWKNMVILGVLDEVKKLYNHTLMRPELPSMQSVGYRQLWRYYDSQIDYQKAEDDVLTATRRLAKRQITWLNSIAKLKPFNLTFDFQQTNIFKQTLSKIQSLTNELTL